MKLFTNEIKYEQWRKSKSFGSNYIKDHIGLGFYDYKQNIFSKVNFAKLNKDSWVIVVDDYDFSATKELLAHNITNIVFFSTDKETCHKYYLNAYRGALIQSIFSIKFKNSLPWKKIVYISINEKKEISFSGDIDIMAKHFDLVISNPPYAIGNEITKSIIDNVEFDKFVNLMPVSKYKGKELYKNVSSIESAEDTFEDAAVGDSLTVAVLKKDANVFESYDSLAITRMNPLYQDFYKLNMKVKAPYEYLYMPKLDFAFDISRDFQVTARTVLDGTHKLDGPGAKDINWNIYNDIKSVTIDSYHNTTQSCFLRFNNSTEKSNLCRFWYYNPLMNALIKGLNASGGKATPAIPNIDWSKERDYEHLTLDDIMNILREENPDVA